MFFHHALGGDEIVSPSMAKPPSTRARIAARATAASGPLARKCSVSPLAALKRITFTGLLASTHGPAASRANSILAPKRLASCVSLTDGRACRPTSLVSSAEPVSDVLGITLCERVAQAAPVGD